MKCLVKNGVITQWPLLPVHIANKGLSANQACNIAPTVKPAVNPIYQYVVERKPLMVDGSPVQQWETLGHAIATVRTNANAAMVSWIDELTAKVTSQYPKDEVASWGSKSEAARAVNAGTARADQTKNIQQEADLSGRTLAEQALSIIAKADVFEEIISKASGLRQATSASLNDAQTSDECRVILDAALSQATALAKDFGL